MASRYQGLFTQRLLSLPILQSVNDLAIRTRLPVNLVSKYLRDNHRYYTRLPLKKKTGGFRPIDSPNTELKALQRWVLRNLLANLSPSIYAKGFIKKSSITDNAAPHAGNQYILSIDLKDFFTTVKASYVFTVFKSVGYSKKISYALTSLCTVDGALPQGAPTSPTLSNLVCLRLDQRIGKYCENKALTYTRYADDITISGNKLTVIRKAWGIIKLIIKDEGYTINKKKELLSGPQSQRKVTGLIVTPRIGIGRDKYNYYRGEIFKLVKKGDTYSIDRLNGILSFIKNVDKDKYNKLNEYYKKITTP
ncbi:retron St85 family RNA-directed DNA polymerase [Serratia ureilytica]|uniref:retron St85 family RNA-directed DNA polymerase n=1 Tax=Serratia ureilytica TaxID=300181 RepID=UPI00313CC38B